MITLLTPGTGLPASLTGSLTTSVTGSLTGSLTETPAYHVWPGQSRFVGLARNADIFSSPIGRQADQETQAPQALDLALALVTSAAFLWVTTGLAALGIAVLVLLRHFRSHHLRSSVAYDLLPTTTFDAAPQAVVNFAHQLGRSRPVRGWLPPSLRSVRVCFRTDDQAKLIMSLRGRPAIQGVLTMQPYAQVELHRRPEGETSSTVSPIVQGGQITPQPLSTTGGGDGGGGDGGGDLSSPGGGGEVTPADGGTSASGGAS